MRQAAILRRYDPPAGVAIATLEYEYGAALEVPAHAHGSDQLIYAISGVMEVRSGDMLWVIPPQFALWVPAKTVHSIRMARAVSMRTLYVRPGRVKGMRACTVLPVNPLLRELTLAAVRWKRLRPRERGERALCELIVMELEKATAAPMWVRVPREPRTARVCAAVLREPGSGTTLEELCRDAGVSARTVQRVFQVEAGIDFNSWRRQARFMKAIGLLSQGTSVKEAAYAVGYQQPSAFIGAFRRTFGETPKAWVKGRDVG